MKETCFFCKVSDLVQRQDGDWHCSKCKRAYFLYDGVLCTRKRKVVIKKMPEPGDNYNDCVVPVERPE